MESINTINRNGRNYPVGFSPRSVWKNPNETANFAAQSVTLSGTGTFYLVKTRNTGSTAAYSYSIVRAGVLSTCTNTYHGTRSRAVTISGTTATFETGYSGGTAGTSHAIPVEIFTI